MKKKQCEQHILPACMHGEGVTGIVQLLVKKVNTIWARGKQQNLRRLSSYMLKKPDSGYEQTNNRTNGSAGRRNTYEKRKHVFKYTISSIGHFLMCREFFSVFLGSFLCRSDSSSACAPFLRDSL